MIIRFPEGWTIGPCQVFQSLDNQLWILTDALCEGDDRSGVTLFRFNPEKADPAVILPYGWEGHSGHGYINHYGQLRVTYTGWDQLVHTDIVHGFQSAAIHGPLSMGQPVVIQDKAEQEKIITSINGLREDLVELAEAIPTQRQIKDIAWREAQNYVAELWDRWITQQDIRLIHFAHNFVHTILQDHDLIKTWTPKLPGWTRENPRRKK